MSIKIKTLVKRLPTYSYCFKGSGYHLKALEVIQNIPTASSCYSISPSECKASHPKQTYWLIMLLNNASICWWVCPGGSRLLENLGRKTMMSAEWSKLSSIAVAKTPIRSEIIKKEAIWHVLLSHLRYCAYSCKWLLFQTVYP